MQSIIIMIIHQKIFPNHKLIKLLLIFSINIKVIYFYIFAIFFCFFQLLIYIDKDSKDPEKIDVDNV